MSTSLVVIDATTLPTILAADKDDILGKLAREIAEHKADPSSPTGRAAIRTLAAKVATAKMDLVRLADTLKTDAQKVIKGVNSERNILVERMDALKEQVRQPLTDYEAIEAARVKAHEDALAALSELVVFEGEPAPFEIEERIVKIEAHADLREWQEFKQRASDARAMVVDCLNSKLTIAKARVAEREEAARLQAEQEEAARQEAARQQAEREAEIARQAAEQAKAEAEARAAEKAAEAARKAQEEQDRIEREKREVEEREIEARERAERAEKEAAEAKAKAEEDRIKTHKLELEAIGLRIFFYSDPSASEIIARLHQPFPERNWHEFANRAHAAMEATTAQLNEMLKAAQKREVAAALQVKRDREEELARAIEADRREAEQKRQLEAQHAAADQERAREADEKRQANVAHRRSINREARDAIAKVLDAADTGETLAIAQAIVEAIATGKIPNCSISY